MMWQSQENLGDPPFLQEFSQASECFGANNLKVYVLGSGFSIRLGVPRWKMPQGSAYSLQRFSMVQSGFWRQMLGVARGFYSEIAQGAVYS